MLMDAPHKHACLIDLTQRPPHAERDGLDLPV
jgi:hypothetical protein